MDGYDGPARPVLAALAAPFTTLYAELLSGSNGELATCLRAMQKSVAVAHLRLIRGGEDLRKADGAPTVGAPKPPGVQVKHPGSRGGKWYRDDHGNVRYGTKPTARYHTALNDDEESQLHTNISASVAEMSTTSLNHLADAMEVDRSVLTTLRTVVQQAASQGLDPQTCFAETYAASFAVEGAESDPKVLSEGHELYANMATAYKEAVNNEKFQKAAKISLARQRQQAVNAAQAVDRQREVVKGHFDALLNGNVAHESIKGLAVMHDMGLFTMPKTLSEAKQYTSNIEEARKLVGRAGINGDRLAAAMKFGDALEPEQQVSLVASAMLGEEQQKRMDDPVYDREAFWQGMRDNPGLDELRDLLRGHGKDYTDQEWEQVKDRTLQMARNVADHIDAYNKNQGGHVFKSLFHNTTDIKKLFSDPAEVDRLNEVEAEVRGRIDRALKAQTAYDHPLEPNITAAMKQIAGPDGDMFGFQKAAVAWMTEIKSGVLAYDAGTGKTPISIALVSHLIASGKAKRGIMVLPANLVAQWPKEIERFRPGSKVQVISADSGSVEDRILKLKAINSGQLEADFVILSAGTLNLHQNTQAAIETESTEMAKKLGKKRVSKETRARLLREGSHLDNDPMVQELKNLDGAMIFDEAHHGGQGLKDPTNTHHLIAQHVLKDREYKFGMTATPMPDGPEDLFHLANLFHPGAAGESMTKFNSSLVKYKTSFDPDTGEKKVVPIAKDMKEMEATKRAIAPFVFFQRKTGQKVSEEMAAKGMSLPNLNSVAHALHLSAEARDMYDKCAEIGFDEGREPLYGHPEGYLSDKEMHAKISEEHNPKAADMVMKMRAFVRQQRAAISPKLLDKNYKGPSPKIDESIEIIKRHFADPTNADKPVVIFGSWMDSLDLMHDEMVKAGLPSHLIGKITGQVSVEDRDVVQDAVNAGKLKVVLIGIKAGGAGLNLQKKAFRNIFLDKPWTPADMEQAVGRTWRTGAKADTVHIHHMKVADTTDERKYAKLGEKVSLVDSLSFADQSEDYLGGMVGASLTRLRGDFDKPLKEMSPQQHEDLMRLAGLQPTDQPFPSLPALREHFDLQKFGEAQKHERWKTSGDEKVKELSVMNDLRLQAGSIDAAKHKNTKAKIAAMARKWMADTKAAADHPVAKYVGENFRYGTEATNSLAGERKDFDPAQESRHRVPEAQLPPPMPLPSTVTHKSQLRWLSADAQVFETTSTAWPIYEMVRRERPVTVAGVAKSLAKCLVDTGVADQAAEDRHGGIRRPAGCWRPAVTGALWRWCDGGIRDPVFWAALRCATGGGAHRRQRTAAASVRLPLRRAAHPPARGLGAGAGALRARAHHAQQLGGARPRRHASSD